MFPELNTLCNISPSNPPSGKSVLIEGSSQDSSFIAHHFISLYLKSNFSVCILGLSQSFNHYNSVGNKLGVSLSKSRDAGNLIFIEGLKLIGEQVREIACEKTGGPTSKAASEIGIIFGDEHKSTLKNFYFHCKEQIEKLKQNSSDSPLLFVIDDLTVFTLLGIQIVDVIHFLTYMRTLTTNNKGCLLTHIQAGPATDDEDLDIIRVQSCHCSHYVFSVESLVTGYSKDVHGQLTITLKADSPGQGSAVKTKKMQFKVLDKTVTFFALGMSSAVL